MKLIVSCLLVAFGAFVAVAEEEKVPLDKLPAKVKEAVKKKFPDAELVAAEKEKEDGKVLYEVGIKNKGQKIEVTVDEEGNVVEIEKELTAADLPGPVKEGLNAKYPKNEIKKVEEVTKGDKTKYEMLIVVGKKTLEVSFAPDGKFIEEEDKTNEKDEK